MEQKIIISVRDSATSEVGYWSGSGISLDRAQSYDSREEAFGEWNDHCDSFPGWEAALIDVLIPE